MPERFEFHRIPTEIAKEHRGLFTRLPHEPNTWTDHERNMGGIQPLCKHIEFVPIEDCTEVWNGDFDAIDVAVGNLSRHLGRDVR